ncbi:unnamed protein product [Polarella glacialis]|uniref:cGMP-dependent protein kinase n=1 Tax=Polarella glacialis TaxID=89957 RepID=A0A813LZS1_POLGL|nr:unnamed protein product [Polarella glacialis]
MAIFSATLAPPAEERSLTDRVGHGLGTAASKVRESNQKYGVTEKIGQGVTGAVSKTREFEQRHQVTSRAASAAHSAVAQTREFEREHQVTSRAADAGRSAVTKASDFEQKHQISARAADAGRQAVASARDTNEKYRITQKVGHGVATATSGVASGVQKLVSASKGSSQGSVTSGGTHSSSAKPSGFNPFDQRSAPVPVHKVPLPVAQRAPSEINENIQKTMASSSSIPQCANACSNSEDCLHVKKYFTCSHFQCIGTSFLINRCIVCECGEPSALNFLGVGAKVMASEAEVMNEEWEVMNEGTVMINSVVVVQDMNGVILGSLKPEEILSEFFDCAFGESIEALPPSQLIAAVHNSFEAWVQEDPDDKGPAFSWEVHVNCNRPAIIVKMTEVSEPYPEQISPSETSEVEAAANVSEVEAVELTEVDRLQQLIHDREAELKQMRRVLVLAVNLGNTLKSFKVRLQQATSLKIIEQKLVFGPDVFNSNRLSLKTLKIFENSVLHLQSRGGGGAKMTKKDKDNKSLALLTRVVTASQSIVIEDAIANVSGVRKLESELTAFMQQIEGADGAAVAIKGLLLKLTSTSLTSTLGCFDGTNADSKVKKMAAFVFGPEINRICSIHDALSSVKQSAEGLFLYSMARADEESSLLAPFSFAVLRGMIENARMFKLGQEEEEDDDMEIEFVEPPKGINRGNRQSVSAEAYGAWNKKAEFNAPVYEKTSEQKARIERCLEPSFLFQGLEKQDMQTVILAFKEKNAEADERIIQEGDDGESMYLIEEGVAECFKKIDGTDLCVKTCSPGDVFGELALLYNCPRAASVVCKEKCILWELDRETFNNIVKEAAAKKRDTYTDFLKKVPLFANVDQYEIMTMADACKEQNFQGEDTVIIKQGDSGDKFYVVVEGECIAKKAFVSGQEPQKVMTHKVGDYFGELALISNTLRAASVHAATPEVKLLSMERRTFTRLLGSMKEILQREGKRYEIADSSHK